MRGKAGRNKAMPKQSPITIKGSMSKLNVMPKTITKIKVRAVRVMARGSRSFGIHFRLTRFRMIASRAGSRTRKKKEEAAG